jgi:hypothetical protein
MTSVVALFVLVAVLVALYWTRDRRRYRGHSVGSQRATDEVFRDPASGRIQRVYEDPATGKREYRDE